MRLVSWIILKFFLLSVLAFVISRAAEDTGFIDALLNLFHSKTSFYYSEKEIRSAPTNSFRLPSNTNIPLSDASSRSPRSSSPSSSSPSSSSPSSSSPSSSSPSSSSPSSSISSSKSPENTPSQAAKSLLNSSTAKAFEYLGPVLGPVYQYYISQHGIDAIRNDGKNICTRKFAIATFACHGGVGNRINEFLNTLFGAMLTNRTVVWRYCEQGHWRETSPCLGSPADCANSISVQPWIGSMDEVRTLSRLQSCPVDYVDELVDLDSRLYAEYPLACGGVENITSRSLTFGKLEGHEMWALTYPGAVLSDQGSTFASSIHNLGPMIFYGSLFHMSFQFSKDLLDANNGIIFSTLGTSTLSQSDIITVGVHSRHINPNAAGDLSQGEEACVSNILNNERSNKTSKCLIFITSDRAKAVKRLEDFANISACIPIAAESISKVYNGQPLDSFDSAEHGEYADPFEVFQNIELISKASFFVGSDASTYSGLISSLSAFRKYLKHGLKFSKNLDIRYHNAYEPTSIVSCTIPNYRQDCSSPDCGGPVVNFTDPKFRWVCYPHQKWKFSGSWYLLPQI